ncbi:AsmA family protein [Lysobacter sp. 5GHs7-4]|uniref:AsmA family protein n=1 Tax=Lysobacter sp. 5GHs7-4 TaxID=2904253 RepID=UPI001E5E50DB|nr:AsmA family protein [Lysobacter sp. 5GHs7-4]UHQ22402.1 AsmA family protein [Lysobacter sp. 5GHs7-4]
MREREPQASPSDPNDPPSRIGAAPARVARSLRGHPWRSAGALALLAILALIALWDWNWLRGPIERQVQARTGRAFDIGGDLDVDLGRTTRIRADALRFGDADWSRRRDMAVADRLQFDIEVWPLLRGEIRIPDLRLQRPRLHLQNDAKRGGNWVFGSSGGEGPKFNRVWIDDGELSFLDPVSRSDMRFRVASLPAGADDAAAPIAARGGGRWKGNRFSLQGRADSPLELRDSERPYRLDVRAIAGATRAHARGSLVDPLRLRDFDLRLALSGQDLADLYPLIGVATPPTPPYALDGRLTRDIAGARTTWHYDGFTGKVGDSDLSGRASVETGGARPYLRADLHSRRLDFDDLGGFVGAAPQTGRGESSNAELTALAAREDASARVLPDTPYRLDKLRAMDADVRLKAQRINAPGWPIDDMDAHLLLEGGVLRLQPLDFGVADGRIRSNVRMDARKPTIATRAEIDARGLTLAKLLPTVQLARDAVGKVGGRIALDGHGNSIADMLASSDGDIAVGMGQGRISNLLMEFTGIDIAEILKFKLGHDRQIPIRCAFGDFQVREGVMRTRALAFDTSDTLLVGKGQIDLGDETLDLDIRARPKDRSLLTLRSPLKVTGTFKHPKAKPDYARLGLRGAAAVALGTIAPPAALLATIELGPGKDAACGGTYAR